MSRFWRRVPSIEFLCGISYKKESEEQTRKIKRSQQIMDILIKSCWHGIKA